MAEDSENPYLPVHLPEFDLSVGWAMCRNAMCRNFGIQYAGPAHGEDTWLSDGRYEINPRTGKFRCGYCGNSFDLNSNRAIRKLARYFLSLSVPFATCPQSGCPHFGRNVFEHHSDDRSDRGRPYRRYQDDRMLCRAHSDKRVTFSLGEPWHLDRGPKRETPADRNKRRRGTMKKLRQKIKGAMYYRSVSMIVEDFEGDADTYYTQVRRAGRRLRDYQSWRNGRLLHPDFPRGEAPLRVYTDTLTASVARHGQSTSRFTPLQVPVSVIDMPEYGTYYILAAHLGLLPEELCQDNFAQLANEVAGPAHTSPWACVWHPPTAIDPSIDTKKLMESLPDVGRGGWFARSPYIEMAHFLTVRKMLSGFPKVHYYMDANRQQSAAALTVFADDIRAGRCEIALYQKRSKAERPPRETCQRNVGLCGRPTRSSGSRRSSTRNGRRERSVCRSGTRKRRWRAETCRTSSTGPNSSSRYAWAREVTGDGGGSIFRPRGRGTLVVTRCG